jgi:TonB-linked SusC/RagA family outer membrane protein
MRCQQLPKGIWLFSLYFLFALFQVKAQNESGKIIKGTVIDENGKPVPSVTVQVKGTNISTSSKNDGTFSIPVTTGNETLVFSSVGFSEKEVPLNGETSVTVKLANTKNTLEDVVVIGYGTQKKRNVSAAVVSFDASKLDERPVNRVDQALVGQMAGVAVKQTSGALGKGFSVQVRGTGSISAGNEPLYVVDGFPLATAAPNTAGNYANGNPLDNINPNDIESIQVLKDAAAAAIYGSRAANGVVIITTKRGRTGKVKLDVNSYAGFLERSKKLDMLNASEWIDRATEMINAQWVASGPGRTADQTNEQRRIILGLAPGTVNTNYMTDDRWAQPGHPGLRFIDWQNEAFRKGLTQNHQVSASGGNEYVRYYMSGNFNRQEGMVINTDYTSYSARANVEVNASKKLHFGINISPTYSITNDPGVEGKDNILHQLLSMTPVQEDTMGLYPNIGNNGQYKWSNSTNSPIGKLQNVIGETKRFRTITSLYGEYQIIPGLNFKTTVNLDNTDNNSKSFAPYIVASSLATRQAQLTAQSSGSYSSFKKQTFVNENTLSYNKIINDVHDLSLLAGFSYNSDKLDNVALKSNGGYSQNNISTLNAATGVTGSTTESRNVLLSYFGRVQYTYDNKYLLTGSLRRDGSSRFGQNTRWGIFPSASVGWRISEEQFMKDIPVINDLKLRGSWGRSGNYNIPDYGTIATVGLYNYSLNGVSVVGQAPTGLINPDLTWEKSETYDVGFDVTVLKNRISASFDYYTKNNTALLLNVPVPLVTGTATWLSNAGAVKNKGWEVEVSSRNIVKGAFQWSTTANLSHNTNRVTSLSNDQSQIIIPSAYGASTQHSILRVGDPMYSIYVVKQIGILTQDDINKHAALYGSETVGDPKYFDANGDGVIDMNDRVIVGHPTPDYVWGITNNFRFKGFDLTVLTQGQWGGSIYSLLGRAIGRTGQGFVDNPLGFFRDRWRSPDDPGAGKVGKAYSTFGQIANTDWLYSSDYIRVRMITLGYDLGRVIKSKKTVQASRIYITAENFFGHDKYKGGFNPDAANTDLSGNSQFPEPGDYGGLPLPKSLILGVNVTF